MQFSPDIDVLEELLIVIRSLLELLISHSPTWRLIGFEFWLPTFKGNDLHHKKWNCGKKSIHTKTDFLKNFGLLYLSFGEYRLHYSEISIELIQGF